MRTHELVEILTLKEYSIALSRTQRLASIGTLTASVAHELNNPISVITATCSDLAAQYAAGELGEETLLHRLQLIEQSAWRCARLIQTLRTYSHIDKPHVVQTDLNQLINDALTLVAYHFLRQFNVTIETTLALDLKPVLCEQNQITQVLINLLTNARDALQPGGGTIHIRSWPVLEENAVAFSVHDTGPGIPASLLEKIFEPFFTTKAAGEGTGLGLSIAAGIVEQHEGRLSVENDASGGARFTVVLPCQPNAVVEEPRGAVREIGERHVEMDPLISSSSQSPISRY